MPGDVESGPSSERKGWSTSSKQLGSRGLGFFYDGTLLRPRWWRVLFVITAGYLIFTLSHISSIPVTVDIVDTTSEYGKDSYDLEQAPEQIARITSTTSEHSATGLPTSAQSAGSHGIPTTGYRRPSISQTPAEAVVVPTMLSGKPVEQPNDEVAEPEKAEETSTRLSGTSTTSSGTAKSTFDVQPYLNAVLDPEDNTLPRLKCNSTISKRYDHLKIPQSGNFDAPHKIKYFFAITLYDCVDRVPSLIGAIVQAIKYLGIESCALSIVEGRSTDGTKEVLYGLVSTLNRLGIEYILTHNEIDPKEEGGDRIARLSALRNQALEPLYANDPESFAEDPIIIFPNDVPLCLDDILELVHQKVKQDADVVCGMDWNMGGKIFYDAWIARDIYGEPFFEVLQGWDWKYADNLFPNNKLSKRRFNQRKPIQVYACWNGIAVLNSAPFLKKGIRFRGRHDEHECEIGEPTYLAKDLWNAGFGRIITVPAVGVAYNLGEGQECKDNYGSTSWNVEHLSPPEGEEEEPEMIREWLPKPANMVCAPGFSPRWWVSTAP